MGPDSDYDPNKAIGDPNNNLYPDQIGNIRAIRRHADALLPAKGKAPCLPRSVLSQRRCLANWDISADVLAVLRPSGGSEKYFRQLQILSTRVGWDDARDRLRAAVASRIANIGRGISSDTQVAVADVTAVLRDLGPEKPASPVPSSIANNTAGGHRPRAGDTPPPSQEFQHDEPSPGQEFQDDEPPSPSQDSADDDDDPSYHFDDDSIDHTRTNKSPSPRVNDDDEPSNLLDDSIDRARKNKSPSPRVDNDDWSLQDTGTDQCYHEGRPSFFLGEAPSPSPPPLASPLFQASLSRSEQVQDLGDPSPDPIERRRKDIAASQWANNEDSVLQGIQIDPAHETLNIFHPRMPTPYPPSLQAPLWTLAGVISVDRPGRRKRTQSAIQSSPKKKSKPDGDNKMHLVGTDHDGEDQGTHTMLPAIPACLSNPSGWLTGQCMADLLRVISAGCQESVCVADSGGSVRHCMFERGGCLAPATRRASTILLPLHICGNHWALAVLPLAEGESLELFDSLGTPARTKHAEEQVSSFLRQLVALWPKGNPRALPSMFRRIKPALEAIAGPRQANTDDCGVAVVAVAMHIMAQKRLPQESHLGMWRRLLCFLAGETLSPDAQRRGSTPPLLLAINDPDCLKVRPDAQTPTPILPPPASGRFDDLELYVQQLQRQVAEFRDQRIESAHKLETTLVGMTSVLGRILERWSGPEPETPGGADAAAAAAEAAARMQMGLEVARQSLQHVQRLLVAD